MYIVQSGIIEMMIGERVIEVCGPNEAVGFMSMIDSAPRSSTARVVAFGSAGSLSARSSPSVGDVHSPARLDARYNTSRN